MTLSIRSCALAVAVAVACAATAPALAQTYAQPEAPLEHRAPNGVGWVSGGVSLEERDAMRDVAPEFNLRIVLAMSGSGEYRAAVPVNVEDENGNPVLSVVSDGPWLFATVPPGRYTVRTGDGEERTVNVGASGATTIYFRSRTE